MKTKFTYKALALALALCLCLAACGASGNKSEASSSVTYAAAPAAMEEKSYSYAMQDAPMEAGGFDNADAIAGGTGETIGIEPAADRKVVYSGSMELQTKEFDDALDAIIKLVRDAGGYISSQETSGSSLTYRGSYYERHANLTARIPVAKFDSVMTGVAGICNVTNRSVWTDDISERYYDTEVHLSTLRLQEERLLDILAKAEKLEDVITLEQALAEVRYEIESLTAQLRRMDDRVDYSTLTLYLQEVVEYSEVETPPATFGERIAEAARRSGRSIRTFFEDLILWIIEDLPVALLWLVLIAAVLWILVRIVRVIFRKSGVEPKKPLFRRRKKDAAPTDNNPDPPASPQA